MKEFIIAELNIFTADYIRALITRLGCMPIRYTLKENSALVGVYEIEKVSERLKRHIKEYNGHNRKCIPKYERIVKHLEGMAQ